MYNTKLTAPYKINLITGSCVLRPDIPHLGALYIYIAFEICVPFWPSFTKIQYFNFYEDKLLTIYGPESMVNGYRQIVAIKCSPFR